ncbi:MAG: arginine deiminase [Mariniphaga sp.]|nr:arginine deiminase [Mariniphaga sp.]
MKIKSCINSEIGVLEGVIIHEPGPEVENMTPDNAERALYSDILNLSVASQEFYQLKGVLDKISKTFEVKTLLQEILEDEYIKEKLLKEVFIREEFNEEIEKFISEPAESLARQLIEGIVLKKDNLTKYLNQERFLLKPLHNLFFTRDASMGINDKIIIGRMANLVRERESIIMENIFNNHPLFDTKTINPLKPSGNINPDIKSTIEGGDFQVAREDVFLVGTGVRTSSQGIDFLIENLKQNTNKKYHIIVKELPHTPESFIHLDMVFTILDVDTCMIYEPVIYRLNRFRTIILTIEGGKVSEIKEYANIPEALKKLGFDLKPVSCGGSDDTWIQEREQWHSGANFFAFAPGKLIGYERNIHTIEELNKNGFEVIKANDIISGEVHPDNYKKCIVTIEGSELARGGGGARCMTMPFRRAEVNW